MSPALARTGALSLLLSALALGACGGDDDVGTAADAAADADAADDGGTTADAAVSPSCLEAADHSDLAWIQDEVFTKGCAAFAACHKGPANSAGGLNLEEGMTEANLVGVPSQLFPDYDLVVPGDPDASYLMIIMGHRDGPLDPEVDTMPLNLPVLCVEKREAVERWILSLGQDA